MAAGAGLLFTALLVVAFGLTSARRDQALYVCLRDLADALLLLAGAAQALIWRLTGRAAPALTGAGLLVVGGLMLPLQGFSMVLHDDPYLMQIAPGCGFVLGAVAVYLCIRSTRSELVEARISPGDEVATMVVVAVMALGSLALFRAAIGPLDRPSAWMTAAAVLALGWLVAAWCYRRPAAAGGDGQRDMSGVAVGLGVASGLLVWGLAHHPAVASAAAVVTALAGGVALRVSWLALELALAQQGDRALRIAGDWGDTVRALADEQAAHEQMLHDARSTLAAIRLANGTLTGYQQQLDAILRAELQTSIDAELGRLEHLLADEPASSPRLFDVMTALAPVVRVARQSGLSVGLVADGAPVGCGCPQDVATVLHSLLANAGRYAGGAPVQVSIDVCGEAVRIAVADSGPGVDPRDRERVFGRGARGGGSDGVTGSGLGLFAARRLMERYGGGLTLVATPGGGATFVAALPLGHLQPVALPASAAVG